jgi:hypothetical protein
MMLVALYRMTILHRTTVTNVLFFVILPIAIIRSLTLLNVIVTSISQVILIIVIMLVGLVVPTVVALLVFWVLHVIAVRLSIWALRVGVVGIVVTRMNTRAILYANAVKPLGGREVR